jgi:hypothetical protein
VLVFNKTFFASKKGNILVSVFTILGLTGFVAILSQMASQRTQYGQMKIQNTRSTLNSASGIEVFLVAYRFAEIHYHRTLKNCDTVRPFYRALKEGSACNRPVNVFHSSNTHLNQGVYSYEGEGCRITSNSSSCNTGVHKLVSVGHQDEAESFNQSKYIFNILSIQPEKQIVEFLMDFQSANTRATRFSFAIRSSLNNTAHLEYDGRVTQANPDPLYPCPGQPWATYFLYNSKNRQCLNFQQLGSGTGLTYYKGRYFGFRPMDGQVIDLNAASAEASGSYLVNESGMVGTENRFPAYRKEPLVNVDDITIIEDQIYYVALSGDSAHIGALDPRNLNRRIRVCNLGEQGWSQAYTGIGSMGWSDPLLPVDNVDYNTDRIARFFLKTDAGDLFTAFVIANSAGTNFECFVTKDNDMQEIEYKRTYGFEKTDLTKPYYIY